MHVSVTSRYTQPGIPSGDIFNLHIKKLFFKLILLVTLSEPKLLT